MISEISKTIFNEFTLNDVKELIKESNNSFLPSSTSPHIDTDSLIKKFVRDSNFKIYGYRNNHLPVTYIIALSYKHKHQIAIGPMFVKDSMRGKKLGKLQVSEFMKIYKNLGFKEVFTKTWLSNEASKKIFTELGFRELSRIPKDRIDGDATVIYRYKF
jgi:RimJ/RimL family protein N-acetyltransferase